MLSFSEMNRVWTRSLRDHALAPLNGENGQYRAIGDKSLKFLEAVAKARTTPLPDVGAMLESGRTVRFWSDPHFSHERIIQMTNRVEFQDVEAMDKAIWANVEQAAVGSDLLVCLGDLALRNPLHIQRKLLSAFPDRQITLVGNHDSKGGKPEAWGASGGAASLAFSLSRDLVRAWVETDHGEQAELVDWKKLPGRISFGCSHWPVPPERMPGPGWLCMHGHIHNRASGALRINCSVEAIRYVPKTLRDLLSAEHLVDLVRRQRGLDGFLLPPERIPGDADYA